MKESFDMICYCCYVYDIYARFEQFYYAFRYVNPKAKYGIAKYVDNACYLHIDIIYMSCVVP